MAEQRKLMPDNEATKPPANGAGGTDQFPNIVLVTVDAFNHDLFMPNLDCLLDMRQLLDEHIVVQGAFARTMHARAEQRRIRKVARNIRPGS